MKNYKNSLLSGTALHLVFALSLTSCALSPSALDENKSSSDTPEITDGSSQQTEKENKPESILRPAFTPPFTPSYLLPQEEPPTERVPKNILDVR